MRFLRTGQKAKPAPVAPRIDPQEAIKLERGAAFKAIDRWYAMDTPGWDTREWDSILMIRGFCQRSIIEATGMPLDEADFYIQAMNYVHQRGGRVARFGNLVYVSARLPHSRKRGDFAPLEASDKDFLPNDQRLLSALKKHGINVSGLALREVSDVTRC